MKTQRAHLKFSTRSEPALELAWRKGDTRQEGFSFHFTTKTESSFLTSCHPLPGTGGPRAALWLLGADWFGSSRRRRQSAERRVRRRRPAEQPTHADQRGEHLQDPASQIHRHAVLQGPLLQPRILWGEAHWHSVIFKCICYCFSSLNGKKVFGVCYIKFDGDRITRIAPSLRNYLSNLFYFLVFLFVLFFKQVVYKHPAGRFLNFSWWKLSFSQVEVTIWASRSLKIKVLTFT